MEASVGVKIPPTIPNMIIKVINKAQKVSINPYVICLKLLLGCLGYLFWRRCSRRQALNQHQAINRDGTGKKEFADGKSAQGGSNNHWYTWWYDGPNC
jgi:hypothetical protein